MIGVRCELVVFIASENDFFFVDMQYDEDDDEIAPDLWQEACWIVIRVMFVTKLKSFKKALQSIQ